MRARAPRVCLQSYQSVLHGRACEQVLTVTVVDLDLSFLEATDLQRRPLLPKFLPLLAVVAVVVVVVGDPVPNLRRVHDDSGRTYPDPLCPN